jgi:hypothetical protein
MIEVLEFKGVNDLNDYLGQNRLVGEFNIIPLAREFDNLNTKMKVSTITYILIRTYL